MTALERQSLRAEAPARSAAPSDAGAQPSPGPEPERFDLLRRLAAEALGTAFLLAIVVGSGIMGQRLSGGSDGLALLANTIATGAGLTVLIVVFGPISGAHFNPAVTLAFVLKGQGRPAHAAAYIAVQVTGAILGVFAAHLMFAAPVLEVSSRLRDGPAQAFSELVATFGLLAVILGCDRFRPAFTPMAVGLYITSAYWFTASTSFANPAVTIARSLTDSFAGIAPRSAPAFIGAQLLGAASAVLTFRWLLGPPSPSAPSGSP